MATISVIVPALNEAATLAPLLARLLDLPDRNYLREIIIADGGSTDGTSAAVIPSPGLEGASPSVRVLAAPRGRASQMNAGAEASGGEVLWFLHADCEPHGDSVISILEALQDPAVVAGAFRFSLHAGGAFYRLVETISCARHRLMNLAYGDMGIFVRKSVFTELGGYREIPLMEDVELWRRLKKTGRTLHLPQPLVSSARRWRSDGVMYNLVRNWALQAGWSLGFPATTLARHYRYRNPAGAAPSPSEPDRSPTRGR